MAELSIAGVVRDLLTGAPELPLEEVIRRAKSTGLRATDEQIRKSVHNQRNSIRAKAATAGAAPTAARKIAPPKAAPAVSAPAATAPGTPDRAAVLGNVVLVNTVVGLCGVESARQTAEAVRACGGVDAFLQLLELVATIRGGEGAK